MRFVPSPRIVDLGILVAVVVTIASGLVSFGAGRPAEAWVFTIHGVTGFTLVGLLMLKLQRVAPRLRGPTSWDGRVGVSVLTLGVATAALITGIAWGLGAEFGFWQWTGLSVHVFFGLTLPPVLSIHLLHRFRLPKRDDFEGRRTTIRLGLLLASGLVAWRVQQLLTRALGSAGRFTGSRPVASNAASAFPVTSWVADDPEPIDPAAWRLRVEGAVSSPITLTYSDLDPANSGRATLDCTSGWYAEREWQGVRVGRLLDAVGPDSNAAWVRFESTTGYRWSLPLPEANDALLATGVENEQLSHGHGAPARLVAPGRRGFQWVKWVVRIEVRETPDYGQWIAIFTSGFS